MKIKASCEQFNVAITNDAGETLYSVACSDYAVELDITAIIAEIGTIKEQVRAVTAALIPE
ncbi:MAG: hypothetical protein KA760_11820 [Steroidobacteraceae bacterium]|nr:hypothetical protein [Steroidobacteraceae bacterium]